jgi:hypothetical protein
VPRAVTNQNAVMIIKHSHVGKSVKSRFNVESTNASKPATKENALNAMK